AWDGVISAVRAYPGLLGRLAGITAHREELRSVLARSRDLALAKSVGLVTRATGSGRTLSPREREIMGYVAQGRRNADIAKSLFIPPGPGKTPLDHISDKLGVGPRPGGVVR